MITDLLLKEGKIDVPQVISTVGLCLNTYLHCCTLQGTLMKFISIAALCTFLPNQLLLTQIKILMQKFHGTMLILTRWKEFFGLLPMEISEVKLIFTRMLKKCKITKLWDVNYKILTRILAIPVVIAATRKNDNLQ